MVHSGDAADGIGPWAMWPREFSETHAHKLEAVLPICCVLQRAHWPTVQGQWLSFEASTDDQSWTLRRMAIDSRRSQSTPRNVNVLLQRSRGLGLVLYHHISHTTTSIMAVASVSCSSSLSAASFLLLLPQRLALQSRPRPPTP